MAKRRKRGDGSVHLRKDGRWEGRVVIGYDDNGYPKTKNVLAKNKKECLQKLKVLKDSLKKVELERLSSDMCFGAWLDHWYQNQCKPTIGAKTQTDYENRIYRHIIPEIGQIPLNRLTAADLQQFYRQLKQGGRLQAVEQYGSGLSDRMVKCCHVTCRAALDQAVKQGLILKNPADACKTPTLRPKEMQVLSPEEIRRLLIQARENDCYELLLLELSTGLRRGEILALQWDDLDLCTGVLRIERQVQRVRRELVISAPKTKSSCRSIILPAPILGVLRDYRQSIRSRWMFPSPKKEDSPLDPAAVRKKLAKVLNRADCKHIRFHDLRHTFATNALEHGMDIKTLSTIIGHVTSATTLNVYAHVTDTMRENAAASIDRSIGKAEPQEEAEPEQKGIVDFQPYVGKKRKPGTGCVSELNDHLFEGRYSPIWPDGTQHSRNVYAHTREECEEKLKALIAEMNEERKNLKEQLAGIAPPEKLTKKQRKLWDYMRLHPEVTEFSTIAKRTGLARNTVKKHYGMVAAMLGRK